MSRMSTSRLLRTLYIRVRQAQGLAAPALVCILLLASIFTIFKYSVSSAQPASTPSEEKYPRSLTEKRDTPCVQMPIEESKPEIKKRNIHIMSWTSRGSSDPSESWYPRDFKACAPILSPGQSCTYSNSRADYAKSDAVLFRGRVLSREVLPKHRRPEQKWIFFEFEPPHKVWMMSNLSEFSDVFNLSSTYSFESDVPLNQKRRCYKDEAKLRELSNVNYAQNKTGLAAWFVSVCRTQSKREAYARELRKHLKVDVYGHCGTLKCGSPNQNTRSQCDRHLLNDVYKFYLSFENSLCKDYVTEKLWRIKNYDVIPVVMGNVDYANLLPQDTYIDVRDFKNPKALAEYIMELDEDDEKFSQYIRNKNSLKVKQDEPVMPYHCRLCKYLHDNHGVRESIHNIASFWSIKNQCIRPQEYFARLS